MSLEGRIALVTGGTRGVGRAISLALAEDGADVAVNYTRDEDAAADTVAAIEKLGGRVKAYRASIQNYDEDEMMVNQILEDLGPVSILINNAGIASRGNSVVDTDPDELVRVVSVHAFAAHYLSKLVLPAMRDQQRGDIIMISSAATKGLGANGAPYNMGKSAQEALAQTLYKEERKHNVRVNVVAPGLVETEMGRRLVRATQGIDDLRKLDATSPFGRVCQPEDISNVVRFLVSEQNSYVTGERLYVNGGSD
jgi:NAD(P)-dependent dehydrogenase (short-subunit alcohol dehydrogenase family)|tara:strand:+ start:1145 stop:1903 length:759 start_codon:yes stop_codon:yes gene_type:complete